MCFLLSFNSLSEDDRDMAEKDSRMYHNQTMNSVKEELYKVQEEGSYTPCELRRKATLIVARVVSTSGVYAV